MKYKIYDLNKLPPKDIDQLIDIISKNVVEKFSGSTLNDHISHTIGDDTPVNKIIVYYDSSNEIVGFLNFKVINKTINTKKYGIIRIITVMLPEFRGFSSTNSFFAKELFKYSFSKIFTTTNIILFFSSVTPTSYYAVSRYVREIYPNHYSETPKEIKDLVLSLSKVFSFDIDLNTFTTRYETISVTDDDYVDKAWHNHPSPIVKFYLTKCPDYKKGQSLITIVPMNFYNLCYCVLSYTWDSFLRFIGIRKSSFKKYSKLD